MSAIGSLKSKPFALMGIVFLFSLSCGVPNFIDPTAVEDVGSPAPPIDPSEDPLNPPVIDPNPPNTPNLQSNKFIHDVPHGAMDILFVVHNKKKMQPFIKKLQEQSAVFLNAIISSPLTQQYEGWLSFKINMITTESSDLRGENITAENAFFAGGNLLSSGLEALPIDSGGSKNLASDKLLDVMNGGFVTAGNSHFFPILVSNSAYEGEMSSIDFLESFRSKKRQSLVYPFGLFFLAGTDSCNDFSYRRASYFSALITQLGGKNTELCQLLEDPVSTVETLIARLYLEMSRKVLSFVPDPQTIKIYVNGLKVSESIWTYHATENEITFSTPPGLGEKIDIVYELKG